MISVIHYISAVRRLEESNKTVRMLGGEKESPPLVLAQRDMIVHEAEYYKERVIKLAFIWSCIAILGTICYTVYVVFNQYGLV